MLSFLGQIWLRRFAFPCLNEAITQLKAKILKLFKFLLICLVTFLDSVEGLFEIDDVTGDITATKEIDYEMIKGNIKLKVEAYDQGKDVSLSSHAEVGWRRGYSFSFTFSAKSNLYYTRGISPINA